MESLISVIIPVYKVEKYLTKCVESVINQTYKNLEIILIDDGSPDNCPKICDDYSVIDNRVKVIHKSNGGLSDARNAGLEIASGDYIMFVDSDDWIEPDMAEVLLNEIKRTSSDIISCSLYEEHQNEETVTVDIPDNQFDNNVCYNFLINNIRPEVCFKMYRSSVIGKIRFDTDCRYAEDVLFNYYVLKNAKKLTALNTPKYHYVLNSGNSITSAYLTDERVNSCYMLEELINKSRDDSMLFNAAVWRYTFNTFGLLNRCLYYKETKEKYFNQITDSLLKNKKLIMHCNLVEAKYRISMQLLSFNRNLYSILFKIKTR